MSPPPLPARWFEPMYEPATATEEALDVLVREIVAHQGRRLPYEPSLLRVFTAPLDHPVLFPFGIITKLRAYEIVMSGLLSVMLDRWLVSIAVAPNGPSVIRLSIGTCARRCKVSQTLSGIGVPVARVHLRVRRKNWGSEDRVVAKLRRQWVRFVHPELPPGLRERHHRSEWPSDLTLRGRRLSDCANSDLERGRFLPRPTNRDVQRWLQSATSPALRAYAFSVLPTLKIAAEPKCAVPRAPHAPGEV